MHQTLSQQSTASQERRATEGYANVSSAELHQPNHRSSWFRLVHFHLAGYSSEASVAYSLFLVDELSLCSFFTNTIQHFIDLQ